MKEKITKAEFINTWASEWDENTGWKVNENFHKQLSEQLEQLISAEVEKRIKERMPSEEESKKEADDLFEGTNREFRKGMYSGFLFGIQWLRSRLTCSEKPNNSQKTEGGEG